MDKVLASDKHFMGHIETLMSIFGNADHEKLEAALKSSDLPAACEALKIKQDTLTAILSQGQAVAQMCAEQYPEVAKTVRAKKRSDA